MTICDLKNEASFNLPQIPRAEIDSRGRFIGGDPRKYLWPPGPRGKAQGALQSVQAEFGAGLDRGALRPGMGASGAGVEFWEMLEFGNKWIPWTPLLDRDHYVAAASFNRYGVGWSFGPVHNLHDEAAGKFAELCGKSPDPVQKGDLDHDMTLYGQLDTEWRERFSVAPGTPPAPPVTPTPSPPVVPPPAPEHSEELLEVLGMLGVGMAQVHHRLEGIDNRLEGIGSNLSVTNSNLDRLLDALEALDRQVSDPPAAERAWWTARLQAELSENEKWPRYLRKIEAILAAREAEDAE